MRQLCLVGAALTALCDNCLVLEAGYYYVKYASLLKGHPGHVEMCTLFSTTPLRYSWVRSPGMSTKMSWFLSSPDTGESTR